LLQLDLVERQGKTVQAGDTLAVARSLLKALSNHGLEPVEAAGETRPFDPAHHSPLAGGAPIQPGQPVLIRAPGFIFQGRRIRKAGVSLVEN
jgi:molecular chaperone GrpE (heat shock protein)